MEELSNGTIQVICSDGDRSEDEAELVKMLDDGELQMVVCSPGNMSSAGVSEVNMLSLLYLFNDFSHWEAAMDGEFGSAMTDIILQKTQNKYRIMGYWSAGVRDYYGKKPITTAADMAGMTIRTQTSGVVSQFWTSIGATPVNIGWGALYDSLKNGEVDSAENDYTNLMLKERAVTYDMMDCSKEKCISDGAIVTEYSSMDIASFKNVAVSIQDSYAQSNGLTQYLEMVRRAQ